MDPAILREPLDRLPDPLPIPVLRRPFNLELRPPGSKSLTNRALLLAALAEGESILRGALTEAEDARVMIAALEKLGAFISRVDADEMRVLGVGGGWRVPADGVTLNLENAGTATRFLTAAAMLSSPDAGPVTIDGNARMRERPIAELVDMLRALGANAEYVGADRYPPVRVRPWQPAELGVPELSVGATASSQFVSAVLLAGAFMPQGVAVRFTQEPTSRSYVEMTVGLLRELGVRVEWQGGKEAEGAPGLGVLRVYPVRLYRFDYEVEPDASGATYFWAAAALSAGSSVHIPGLTRDSLQGDVAFVDELERMGAAVERTPDGTRVLAGAGLEPTVADLTLMPDAAMTLAAACCFAPGRSVIAGLKTLRVKETDRIAALEQELAKLGIDARAQRIRRSDDGADDEGLSIVTPEAGLDCSANVPRIEFDTYKDHRMAMSLALIGLRRPNVFIRDPGCVAKTYPTFWRDLASLYTDV